MSRYKNIIEFRVLGGKPGQQNRGASGYKEVEVELDYELHPSIKDYDVILRNLVQSSTGVNAEDVIQYKVKKRTKIELNSSENEKNLKYKDIPPAKESIVENGLKSIGKGLIKMGDENVRKNEIREKSEKLEIDTKVSEISNISFDGDIESIQRQVEDLLSYGSTISSAQLPIRKAAYTKVILGINRLKNQRGLEISHIVEQANKLKPKWYHSLGYLFHTS